MATVNPFPYFSLTNGNASQLFGRLIPVYKTLFDPSLMSGPTTTALGLIANRRVEDFDVAARQFADAIRQDVKSSFTYDLDTLDAERDAALAAVDSAISRGMRHSNDAVSAAARLIEAKRMLYRRLAQRQRDEQTRLTEQLLRDLAAPDLSAAGLQLPGFAALVAALAELNAAFANAFSGRQDQRSGIVTGLTAELRTQANAAAAAVVAAVNMVSDLYPATFLDEIIDRINFILAQARLDLSNRRRGRAQREKEEVNNEQLIVNNDEPPADSSL